MKPFKKRKHRNGKRPERKGSIKINLQPLPDAWKMLMVRNGCSGLKEALLCPKSPELDYDNWYGVENQRRIREHKAAHEAWIKLMNRIIENRNKLRKGYEYVTNFNQVSPADIVMDVINDVQPEAPIKFYVNDHCNECKRQKRCPLMKLEYLERSERCKKLVAAYEKHCEDIDNGTYQKPMDYSADWQRMIAEAWELPNN